MKLEGFRDILNFRDLGGYPASDSRKIRPGCFYRSGGLFFLTPEEMEHFYSLNVSTVIDLRTVSECEEMPDPDLGGTIVQQHSGLMSTGGDEIDFSPRGMLLIGAAGEKQFADLHRYYIDMPYDNEAFRLIFDHIRAGHTPILFHCASGKDRTGVASIMVMGLLGCDRETILSDYTLSNTYCSSQLIRAFEECDVDLNEHPERRDLLQMMHGVLPSIGSDVYDGIIERYGSMENLLMDDYGFTADEITEIRNCYLY